MLTNHRRTAGTRPYLLRTQHAVSGRVYSGCWRTTDGLLEPAPTYSALSPLSTQHSALSTQHSALSPLSTQHSALRKHSALLKNRVFASSHEEKLVFPGTKTRFCSLTQGSKPLHPCYISINSCQKEIFD